MRKITEDAVNAFISRRDWKSDNTEVVNSPRYRKEDGSEVPHSTHMLLNNNGIAHAVDRGRTLEILLTDCGWLSSTTQERLNGLLKAFGLGIIFQRNRVWYLRDDDGVAQRWHGRCKIHMRDGKIYGPYLVLDP